MCIVMPTIGVMTQPTRVGGWPVPAGYAGGEILRLAGSGIRPYHDGRLTIRCGDRRRQRGLQPRSGTTIRTCCRWLSGYSSPPRLRVLGWSRRGFSSHFRTGTRRRWAPNNSARRHWWWTCGADFRLNDARRPGSAFTVPRHAGKLAVRATGAARRAGEALRDARRIAVPGPAIRPQRCWRSVSRGGRRPD